MSLIPTTYTREKTGTFYSLFKPFHLWNICASSIKANNKKIAHSFQFDSLWMILTWYVCIILNVKDLTQCLITTWFFFFSVSLFHRFWAVCHTTFLTLHSPIPYTSLAPSKKQSFSLSVLILDDDEIFFYFFLFLLLLFSCILEKKRKEKREKSSQTFHIKIILFMYMMWSEG